MKFAIEFAGLIFSLDLNVQHQQASEAEPQGSTCGVLERADGWDLDQREPVGFTSHRSPAG